MPDSTKLRRSFPLRLSKSMRLQANDLARIEGLSLNQFILVAIAEKVGRMEHATWLKEMTKPALTATTMRPPARHRD
jgi:hypothetical protein